MAKKYLKKEEKKKKRKKNDYFSREIPRTVQGTKADLNFDYKIK